MSAARRAIICAGLGLGLAVLATIPIAAQQAVELFINSCSRDYAVEAIWRDWRQFLIGAKDESKSIASKLASLPSWFFDKERSEADRREWTHRYKLPEGFWEVTPTERCQLHLAVLRSDGVPEMPAEVRALLKRVVEKLLEKLEKFEKDAAAAAAANTKSSAPK